MPHSDSAFPEGMRNMPPLSIPDEARTKALASLKRYMAEELELDVGDLKSGLFLDYIVAEIGPTVHNQAIAEARAFIEERAADLDAAHDRVEFPYWAPAPKRDR